MEKYAGETSRDALRLAICWSSPGLGLSRLDVTGLANRS